MKPLPYNEMDFIYNFAGEGAGIKNDISEIKESTQICPVCGKEFAFHYDLQSYAYKCDFGAQGKKAVCSYTCMRNRERYLREHPVQKRTLIVRRDAWKENPESAKARLDLCRERIAAFTAMKATPEGRYTAGDRIRYWQQAEREALRVIQSYEQSAGGKSDD